MSNDSYTDYICRICGNEDDLFDIFHSEVSENKLLSEVFSFVTCLEVSEEDGCSKVICKSCKTRLEDAYSLKKQAQETYETFLEYKTKKSNDNQSTNASEDNDDDKGFVKIEIVQAGEEDELSGSSFADNATDAVEFLISRSKLTERDIRYPYPRKQRNKFSIEDKKHECQICNKRFLRKSNLIDHQRLHANVKLFKCEFCEKSFVQSGNYKSHLRTHTNEKPFVCPICQKAYNQSSALRIHIRSHTDERNYTCEVCSKGFTNSSDLNKHKRVHDPSKQFECQFCKKLFAQKANLKLHQNNIHRDKILEMEKTEFVKVE